MGEGLKRATRAAQATQLTDKQHRILCFLRTQPESATCVWIAEACGHAFDTPWASSAMPRLANLDLVEKVSRGWWRITDAGKEAIKDLPVNFPLRF